jgi:hypothetical protein
MILDNLWSDVLSAVQHGLTDYTDTKAFVVFS